MQHSIFESLRKKKKKKSTELLFKVYFITVTKQAQKFTFTWPKKSFINCLWDCKIVTFATLFLVNLNPSCQGNGDSAEWYQERKGIGFLFMHEICKYWLLACMVSYVFTSN